MKSREQLIDDYLGEDLVDLFGDLHDHGIHVTATRDMGQCSVIVGDDVTSFEVTQAYRRLYKQASLNAYLQCIPTISDLARHLNVGEAIAMDANCPLGSLIDMLSLPTYGGVPTHGHSWSDDSVLLFSGAWVVYPR